MCRLLIFSVSNYCSIASVSNTLDLINARYLTIEFFAAFLGTAMSLTKIVIRSYILLRYPYERYENCTKQRLMASPASVIIVRLKCTGFSR